MKKKESFLHCPSCKKKFKYSNELESVVPFCSKRCKVIDLGKWLGEKYVVSGERNYSEAKDDIKGED